MSRCTGILLISLDCAGHQTLSPLFRRRPMAMTRQFRPQVLTRDPASTFMAYAVVAIAPLISENQPLAQGPRVSVHILGKCLKVLELVFRQDDGVDVTQCLHLLVVLALHCSAAGSAWHLVGFAMSKCIALGYHRENPRSVAPLSPSDIQQRRWDFWGCYHIERFICAALARLFSIDDRDISTPMPSTSPEASGGGILTSENAVPPLTLREQFYIHHFRYATLLFLTAQNLPDTDAATQETGFDYYLGHALRWRSDTPPHQDPSVRQVYQYHTLLYKTLLLRIAIIDISRRFIRNKPDTTAGDQESQTNGHDDSLHPGSHPVLSGQLRYVFR